MQRQWPQDDDGGGGGCTIFCGPHAPLQHNNIERGRKHIYFFKFGSHLSFIIIK